MVLCIEQDAFLNATPYRSPILLLSQLTRHQRVAYRYQTDTGSWRTSI